MDSQLYSLRAKKIGLKIAIARQKKMLSIEDLAQKLGLHAGELAQMEKGITSPSLPQLQVMASVLDFPMDDLLNTKVLEPLQQEIDPSSLPRYYEIRNRMLGIQVKKNRFQLNLSVEQLAKICDIPDSDLELYESGQASIPLPVLLKISEVLHLPYEKIQVVATSVIEETEESPVVQSEEVSLQQEPEPSFIGDSTVTDSSAPPVEAIPTESIPEVVSITNTDSDLLDETPVSPQTFNAVFPDMSDELREFIQKPVNLPYLELALKLSRMDAKKLRDIAESLLEITL